MASEPTSPLQLPPPSLSLLSLKSSSVQSASPLPPHPSSLPLCGWCNIMSVGEGMACLCAPEGLPTHCWKEKATRVWIPPNPPLFKHPFHPHHHYSARALRDSIVSHTHTPTNAQRSMMITKTGGRAPGVILCFLPLYACSDVLIGHMDPHATLSLPFPPLLNTTSLFLNTPLQNVGVLHFISVMVFFFFEVIWSAKWVFLF